MEHNCVLFFKVKSTSLVIIGLSSLTLLRLFLPRVRPLRLCFQHFRNTIVMLKVFLLLLAILIKNCHQMKRIDDICSTEHLKRVFLRLGESGVLTAYNITVNSSGSYRNISSYEGCQVEIVTCPSCIVSLTFKYMNLSCYCGSGLNLFLYNPCRCDYVWVTEPPYASGTSFCKTIPSVDYNAHENYLGYRSTTRIVRISLFYNQPHFHAFTIDYKSETNRQLFFGTPEPFPGLNLSSGFISSPFFPAVYPRDIVVEYFMTCVTQFNYVSSVKANTDYNCRVRLIFSDFQLALSSVMEFYDGKHRIDVVSGSEFRPPVIVTTTNTLAVRFSANGQNHLGFKAFFSFVSDDDKKIMKPVTDCGGFVENLGGTITMMNMVNTEVKLYDCIWLIKPLKNVVNLKTHLYLKITTFVDFAGEAELLVRQGLTSKSPVIDTLRHPVSQNFNEHVFPLKSGYYVSLKALFGPASHFAIAYSAFSYNQCLVFSDFLCRNYRCISKKLKCDGFDHCGDNSDELPICYQERGLKPTLDRWYTHTPNYYFPKMKSYSDLQTASLVFLFCVIGLIFFAFALTILFYKIGTRTQEQRSFQNQLQSLSDFTDILSDVVYTEDIVIDDPPSYESPPNYEDVVKSSLVRFTKLGNIQQKLSRPKRSQHSAQSRILPENSRRHKSESTECYSMPISASRDPTPPLCVSPDENSTVTGSKNETLEPSLCLIFDGSSGMTSLTMPQQDAGDNSTLINKSDCGTRENYFVPGRYLRKLFSETVSELSSGNSNPDTRSLSSTASNSASSCSSN